ncbi:serine/threonine protein kinase [Myxococcota bacterium]|nr:serine/threonine protein kinase [Myxococcota bacterium]
MTATSERYCLHCGMDSQRVRRCGYGGCRPEDGGLPVVADPHGLDPGSILNGKYLVGRVLGHGAFGITYVGVHRDVGLRVAIKEFLPTNIAARSKDQRSVVCRTGVLKADYQVGVESFLNEARTLARLNGAKNVVQVRDFFTENNTAYVVMEFVTGRNVQEWLESVDGPLERDDVLWLADELLQGLAAIHAAGVLHRDIKPTNLMVTPEPSRGLRIIDFGTARSFAGASAAAMTRFVTDGYSAPEQYSRDVQGPGADLYAAAATLITLATGVVPPAVPERMISDSGPTLRAVARRLGQARAEAIGAAWSIDPSARPASAADFRAALNSAIGSETDEGSDRSLVLWLVAGAGIIGLMCVVLLFILLGGSK